MDSSLSSALDLAWVSFTEEAHAEPCGSLVAECTLQALWKTIWKLDTEELITVLLCDFHMDRVKALDDKFHRWIYGPDDVRVYFISATRLSKP